MPSHIVVSHAHVSRLSARIVASAVLALSCCQSSTVASQRGDTSTRPLEPSPNAEQIHYRFSATPAPTTDTDAAIRFLEARVKAAGNNATDAGDLADAYLRRAQTNGDVEGFRQAEEMAKRSLDILPSPNGATLTLAKIAGARHDFQQAIAIAQAALAHKRSAGAYGILATDYLALGRLAEATDAAESAIEIAPSMSAYLTRALVMQAQGRDAEAAFDFAHALTVETPDDRQESARVRTLWGRFCLRRGDLTGAAMLFDEALRIVPAQPLALAHQAELALRRGQLKEARAGFEQAFASSRQLRYLMDLSRAQELAGDAAAAESSRAQVETIIRAELEEKGIGHQLDLVEILVDRARPADLTEAVTRARDEVSRRPSAETRFQLARALARSGANVEAKQQVHAALATGVRDARLYELAARVENGPRSTLYTRLAEQLDPGASGWRQLGLAH